MKKQNSWEIIFHCLCEYWTPEGNMCEEHDIEEARDLAKKIDEALQGDKE